MGRHGFGRGEYKYFRYPLPTSLRNCARVFTRVLRRSQTGGTPQWASNSLSRKARRIHPERATTRAGEARRRVVQYGEGDYNCLHQDLYGEHVFPIQVAILLSEPSRDFTGGEFVLTEQTSGDASRPSGSTSSG